MKHYKLRKCSISLLLFIVISYFVFNPTLIWLNDLHSVSGGAKTSFTLEEYVASLWLKDNEPNSFIISDPYTQLIFSSLSGNQHVGEEQMSGKAREIVQNVISTPYAKTAHSYLTLIASQNIAVDYSMIDEDAIFQRGMISYMRGNGFDLNLSNSDILVIVTPRTIDWSNNLGVWDTVLTQSYLWKNMFPSTGNISVSNPAFLKFFNEAYFQLLYEFENQIYIFKVKFDGLDNFSLDKLGKNTVEIFDDEHQFWTVNQIGQGTRNYTLISNPCEKIYGNFSAKIDITSGSYDHADIKHNFVEKQNWSEKDFLGLYIYGVNDYRTISIYLLTPNWSDGGRYDLIDNWEGWAYFEIPLNFPTDTFGFFDISKVSVCYISNACIHSSLIIDRIFLANYYFESRN